MTTVERYILAAFGDDVLSSYQIASTVEQQTGWRPTMAQTYEALLALLGEHMVARAGTAPVGADGKIRRVYAITPYGQKALIQ